MDTKSGSKSYSVRKETKNAAASIKISARVQLGSLGWPARLGLARLGLARLGLARLGSQNLSSNASLLNTPRSIINCTVATI